MRLPFIRSAAFRGSFAPKASSFAVLARTQSRFHRNCLPLTHVDQFLLVLTPEEFDHTQGPPFQGTTQDSKLLTRLDRNTVGKTCSPSLRSREEQAALNCDHKEGPADELK